MFGNNDMQFAPQDWQQMALTAGLSMLSNNNGSRSVGQLIGQGGLDALAGLQARKQYEQTVARQQAEDERTQAQHDMQMKKGQLEMAEAERINKLKERFASGDRSPEVMYGLFGKEMTAHDLALKRIYAEQDAKAAAAKKEQEQQIALWRKLGLLPSEPSAPSQPSTKPVPSQPAVQPAPKSPTLTPPATPTVEQGGQPGTQAATPAPAPVPVPALAPTPEPTSAPTEVNPYANWNLEAIGQLAMLPTKEGAKAREMLKEYRGWQSDMAKAEKDRVEAEAKSGKAEKAEQEMRNGAGFALNAANTIEDLISDSNGWKTTGYLGSKLGEVAGTDAYAVRQNLNTLKAALSFEKLQAMRNASPTGGALGNVSDMELRLLASTVASLDPNMDYEQFARNLSIVKAVMSDIANNTQTAFIRDKDGKFLGFKNEYDDKIGRYSWRGKLHGGAKGAEQAQTLDNIWGQK